MKVYTAVTLVLACFLTSGIGYKTHTALNTIIFTHLEEPDEDVHSEYYFGKCATPYKVLMRQVHYNFEDIKYKMIVRGWINYRHINHYNDTSVAIPNCVYIRAKSSIADKVKYDSMKFNICVCTIIVCYASHKFVDVFFEWYIPVFMRENIEWDLFFYLA